MSGHNSKKEAFSRVVIDAQSKGKGVGWNFNDGHKEHYEYQLPDGTFADYVLNDRHGRAMVVIKADKTGLCLANMAICSNSCRVFDDVWVGIQKW